MVPSTPGAVIGIPKGSSVLISSVIEHFDNSKPLPVGRRGNVFDRDIVVSIACVVDDRDVRRHVQQLDAELSAVPAELEPNAIQLRIALDVESRIRPALTDPYPIDLLARGRSGRDDGVSHRAANVQCARHAGEARRRSGGRIGIVEVVLLKRRRMAIRRYPGRGGNPVSVVVWNSDILQLQSVGPIAAVNQLVPEVDRANLPRT